MPRSIIPPLGGENVPILSTDNFDLGLIIDIDPARLPVNGLTIAENVIYTLNQLYRRSGSQLYSITSPDSNKILNIFAVFTITSGINILRFTAGKIYKVTSSGWDEITPDSISANSGTNTDYFQLTVADDRIFFCQGVDDIREIHPDTLTYTALGDAPTYKYLCSAFDRVIGANFVPDIPYQIGWSGNLNYDEWDPNVDRSAGFTPLVNSPSDVDDDITGVLNGGSFLIVPRARSIWLGNVTQAATNPFNFYAALPRTGADVPRSIALTSYGLIWYSYEDSTVYLWDLESKKADSISDQVNRAIKSSITDPTLVWASFSRDYKLYSLYVGNNLSSEIIEWQYNFITKNWVLNRWQNLSAVSDIDYPGSSVTIDELTGDIDSLIGTIDSLGGLVAGTNRFLGYTNGLIQTLPFFSGLKADVGNINLTDNGISFTSITGSKIIEIPPDNTCANLFRLSVTPYTVGTVSLEYSKDDGLTWTNMKSVTFNSNQLYKGQLIQLKRFREMRRFLVRATSVNCMYALNGLVIRATEGGVSK